MSADSNDRAGARRGRWAAHGDIVLVSSPTEERNPRTEDIDTLEPLALLERINDEDALVPAAVRRALPQLAVLVEAAVTSLRRHGRVHYFGAGTSGRIGLLDAAEIPPTYGLSPDVFVAHLAGGDAAVRVAQEGSEDDDVQGAAEAGATVRPEDTIVGMAASGYTPYVCGALQAASTVGAHTALITSNPSAPLAAYADTVICLDTGPEVITGSTRMKAATAQKLALNAFSTAVMVRSGRTWSNLMADVVPSNNKLRGRLLVMMTQATGASYERCDAALGAAGGEVKTALVTLQTGSSMEAARHALAQADGVVGVALGLLASQAKA